MADLDDVAQRMPAAGGPATVRESRQIGRVEFFGRRELPQQRAKPVA